ncbi:histidine protein methyltransferase 1 homolog [Amphiura filiformis]|uniref:histidine protein methyltransferase 1 homolog n=1 Tax=Amphiura filiformis TaxID=82378 RepID=UPI003B222EE1
MAFMFNFSAETADDKKEGVSDSNCPSVQVADIKCDKTGNHHLTPASEVCVHKQSEIDKSITVSSHKVGSTILKYLDPSDVEEQIRSRGDKEGAIIKAISAHSDLVAHVYEGGLKIWECSLDLIHYLQEVDIDFTNKKVLELGCGAGLPGIFALKHGAENVTLQDYNEEVLEEMTVPNVLLNSPDDKGDINGRCRFIAGDWSRLESFLKDHDITSKYDIILTSETIYSIESQPVLHDVLKALLSPGGTVYVAAKTHYFGVGGGTRMFEDLVKERGDFTINVCKEYKDGVQREILKMKLTHESDNR